VPRGSCMASVHMEGVEIRHQLGVIRAKADDVWDEMPRGGGGRMAVPVGFSFKWCIRTLSSLEAGSCRPDFVNMAPARMESMSSKFANWYRGGAGGGWGWGCVCGGGLASPSPGVAQQGRGGM
jgi:hypothetical protein